MSDMTTNRDGSYLKAHAEMETEDSLAPGSPRRLFKLHWDEAVTNLVANGGREPSAHSRAIAETFFLWGWYDGRLAP